jgi:hypothetical protein
LANFEIICSSELGNSSREVLVVWNELLKLFTLSIMLFMQTSGGDRKNSDAQFDIHFHIQWDLDNDN